MVISFMIIHNALVIYWTVKLPNLTPLELFQTDSVSKFLDLHGLKNNTFREI